MSAICFNLDQPKILSSGNGLNVEENDALLAHAVRKMLSVFKTRRSCPSLCTENFEAMAHTLSIFLPVFIPKGY